VAQWRSMSCAFWRPDPRHGAEPREPSYADWRSSAEAGCRAASAPRRFAPAVRVGMPSTDPSARTSRPWANPRTCARGCRRGSRSYPQFRCTNSTPSCAQTLAVNSWVSRRSQQPWPPLAPAGGGGCAGWATFPIDPTVDREARFRTEPGAALLVVVRRREPGRSRMSRTLNTARAAVRRAPRRTIARIRCRRSRPPRPRPAGAPRGRRWRRRSRRWCRRPGGEHHPTTPGQPSSAQEQQRHQGSDTDIPSTSR
jgi:hypothetical protein